MNYTLEDIKKFILEFTELEYQYGLGAHDNSIDTDRWNFLVEKLESYYGNRYGYFSTISKYRNESLMNEEELSIKKRNLRKRKLFLIRKYKEPSFGKGILNTDSDIVFSCFLGANLDMGVDVYPNNISVGIVNDELKIITERKLNSERRRNEEVIEWIYNERSNTYIEDITIKKDGTVVETLRIIEPEHPTWLADYNKG